MAHDLYDAESAAGDLAMYSGHIFHADISEVFDTNAPGDGHGFLLDTPDGRRFMVTVAEADRREPPNHS